ncbi:MAG: universal stress protein, partial [Gemmatimonadetes bacterium]|nr:universal stress protein [Gemmatimonadota bacterium]
RQKEAAYLTDLVGRLEEQGLEAVAERLEGEVAPQLIERAKSDADLLVMATHGRAGLERAWLGSVADEVVHHVKLP